MTDRELLELAAKAAGLPSARWCPGRECIVWGGDPSNPRDGTRWSPLHDDGDALRLSNKLWLEVRHVYGTAHAGKQGEFWCSEPWFPDGNQNAATRRAITRAAASMAKEQAIGRCACGYPMPCAKTVPAGFCRQPISMEKEQA